MPAPADLRLAGGQALLPGRGLVEADILVAGGRIAGVVAPGAGADAAETVSVRGLALLPGAIDAHLHLGHGTDIARPREPADADAETAAAARGGVTCFVPYMLSTEDYLTLFPGVRAVTEQGARIDFGYHFIVATEEHLANVPRYVRELGVPTMKFFMNSRGNEGARIGLPHVDDGYLYRLLEQLRAAGGMLCPHPESIEVAWVLRDRVMAADPEGKGGLAAWNATRPPFVEAEAIRRACYFGRIVGVPVFCVHVSAAEALAAARAARAEGGEVLVETCPHYLLLDITSRQGDEVKVNPPLREASDREALWAGIASGEVDTVGTDHNHRPRSVKAGGIWKAQPGFPGLDLFLPSFLSEGLHRRGLPLQRLSDVVSANPARIMGLAPAKGTLTVGADADIVALDLDARWTVGPEHVSSSAGYSPFEGEEMRVRVAHTLVRGRFVVREGALDAGAVGHGRYVARRLARG